MNDKTERANRPRRRTFDAIEAALWEWGDWMAKPVRGISYPSESPEQRIRTMYHGPERRKRERLTLKRGEGIQSPMPDWAESWQANPKSTRSTRPVTPLYSAHPREARTHRAILDLPRDLRLVVVARYVQNLNERRGSAALCITRDQYQGRLALAKSTLRLRLGVA